jgi:hypothetical protein
MMVAEWRQPCLFREKVALGKRGFLRDKAAIFLEGMRHSPEWCRRIEKVMMHRKLGLRSVL